MDDFMNTTTYTASEARERLYELIRTAADGMQSFEITLRGAKPVMLVSKKELESWLETIDIVNSPEEVEAIRDWKKNKRTIPYKKVVKMLGLDDED